MSVHSSFTHNSQNQTSTRHPSTNEWLKHLWHIRHRETLLGKEKEQIIDSHSYLKTLWRIMLRGKSNPQRLHTQDPIHLTFVKLQNCRNRGQINGCQGLRGREMGVGVAIKGPWRGPGGRDGDKRTMEGSWGPGWRCSGIFNVNIQVLTVRVLQDRTLGKISDPNMGPLSITSYNCCVCNYMKIQSLMKTKGRGRSGERKEGRGERRERQRGHRGPWAQALASERHPAQDSPRFPPPSFHDLHPQRSQEHRRKNNSHTLRQSW